MSDAAARGAAVRWMRVKELTGEALERSETERPAWLTQACGGDETLRREVESLLSAHAKAADFLETPGVAATGAAAAIAAVTQEGPPPVAVGHVVGPYRIVRELGQGGMGVVYLAERADAAFEKQVAIKVVRGGLAGGLEARFHEERRILATLDHPNIAKLLDGGTTADGLSYVVMEYVDGVAVDTHCEAAGLSLRERLALFRQVCAAVQYAHQRLVIHRDLKARNILVTADGTPKLLDFGIARLLDPGRDPSEQTRTALRAFSLEAASPEQVRDDPITVTSDVYALGALLYRLLTGQGVYGPGRRTDPEILRAICEETPPPPSAVAPPEKQRALRSDVDGIVLKALRKEPDRRYLSVEALSEDIRRHLEGRPVLARPDTLTYRASKFVGRHRASVAAAALAVASLVGGLAMTVRQARIAEANRLRAEQRFADVRELAKFVMFDMHDAIEKLPGSTPARKQLVEKALRYLDRVASEGVTDPALLGEVATGYERLSEVLGDPTTSNLGDKAGALASIRKAIPIRERLAAGTPVAPRALAELAWCYMRLGGIAGGREARGLLEKVKGTLDAVPAQGADDTDVLGAWERYHDFKSDFEIEDGDFAAVRETRRKQVEVAEKLLTLDAANPQRHRNVALASKYYGGVLHKLNELEAARRLYDRALALDQELLAAEPSNPLWKLDLSFSHGSIGSLLRDQGDGEGAIVAYAEALRLREDVRAADPSNQQAFYAVWRAHQSMSFLLAQTRADLAGAIGHERQLLRVREDWETKHPSAHGPAALQASFHWAVGDHAAVIAADTRNPVARRRAHWRRAREEYTHALDIWLDLGRKKPLEGEAAGNPAKLRDAIKKCDEALAFR